MVGVITVLFVYVLAVAQRSKPQERFGAARHLVAPQNMLFIIGCTIGTPKGIEVRVFNYVVYFSRFLIWTRGNCRSGRLKV